MANHKSAEKAARKAIRRTAINKSRVSRMRTFVKKAESVLLTPNFNPSDAMKAIVDAEKELMRGVRKGVILQNTASRKVSRMVQKVKKQQAAS
jgi:small subunit ribosomal protein S20